MKLYQEVEFDSAHRLYGYDGSCGVIHGHRWKAEIEILSYRPLDKCGMLIDYRDIKKLFDDMFDHKTILNVDDPLCDVLSSCGCKVTKMIGNPTAENLAILMVKRIIDIFDLKYNIEDSSDFVKVTVHESPKNYAEYTSYDLCYEEVILEY